MNDKTKMAPRVDVTACDYPILIVDDDSEIRMLLEITLKHAGYEVDSARNGVEALHLYKARFYPILITDWMMPQVDGLTLCKKLRETQLPGYLFIVMLTAKDSQPDIISGLEAGADDYLIKPFSRAELLARLMTANRILNLEKRLIAANERIKLLSITDPLTGCYNRGHLSERFPNEIKRAKRNGRPLSVILCDIDRFKSVNDTYGHQVGDLVLKTFVHRINETVRDGVDLVFRYGGEEFLLLLSETTVKDALTTAERIRNKITETQVILPTSSVNITASFGVTGFETVCLDPDTTLHALIEQADEYLYQSKQEGRNLVRGGPLVLGR